MSRGQQSVNWKNLWPAGGSPRGARVPLSRVPRSTVARSDPAGQCRAAGTLGWALVPAPRSPHPRPSPPEALAGTQAGTAWAAHVGESLRHQTPGDQPGVPRRAPACSTLARTPAPPPIQLLFWDPQKQPPRGG